MNSAKQKDFEHATPSDQEIQDTISFIREKLDEWKTDDDGIKAGYQAAVGILTSQVKSTEEIPAKLITNKSKAIAILAVNYLNGECSREVLIGFGLPG